MLVKGQSIGPVARVVGVSRNTVREVSPGPSRGVGSCGPGGQPVWTRVDELGFVPFGRTGGELLFNLLAERHERRSTLITTKLTLFGWVQIPSNEKLTTALHDRLASQSHIVTTKGPSCRTRRQKSDVVALRASPPGGEAEGSNDTDERRNNNPHTNPSQLPPRVGQHPTIALGHFSTAASSLGQLHLPGPWPSRVESPDVVCESPPVVVGPVGAVGNAKRFPSGCGNRVAISRAAVASTGEFGGERR